MFKNNVLKNLNINGNRRSKDITINVIMSVAAKGMSVISSLLIVPLTISYLSPSHYGIWMTLSSIVTWVYYFDLGLGNGFRNKFSEALSRNDIKSAREYVSTAYTTIFFIVLLVYVICFFICPTIDWVNVLNLPNEICNQEIAKIMLIILAFICLNMVAQLFGILLTADQKIGIAAIIQGLGQVASLVVIYFLTKITTGTLENMALFFSGVPFIVMLIASIVGFSQKKYRQFLPSFNSFRISKVKDILSLGFKFFFIYVCLIFIFQIINVVILRELGSIAVTKYNIANRYFSAIFMIVNLIVAPFWSACTEAYCKKEYQWMSRVIKRLERVWVGSLVIGLIMLLVSPFLYEVWIGDSVEIPFLLSVGMFLFYEAQSIGSIYMTILNGIGKVDVQLMIYMIFSVLSWPALVYSCRLIGLNGVFILPTIVYIIQAIAGKKQLNDILIIRK